MELTIECKTRRPDEKVNTLRREGQLPAVLYGHNGAESVSLTVNAKEAERLLRDASINNTLITLQVPEISWTGKALLREVQTHPWKDIVYHLSFFSIGQQESVQVSVPIHYSGEADGVKNNGGTLDTVMTELTVDCAPGIIPEAIDVNVSALAVGDALHISELVLPTGVTAVGDADQVVVSVLPSKVGAGETSDQDKEMTEA